ncbi:hypothetical protein [Rufibacter psychrotolerans]|uniref:hypothetical protein n=1 Tax=Rufibacter psychrotolerans TaxID=2812556 RepID=UPI001966D03C|nr:hypothetical protein [Rufibacter sp. SYSU D00308]
MTKGFNKVATYPGAERFWGSHNPAPAGPYCLKKPLPGTPPMDFDIPQFKKRLEQERLLGSEPAHLIQQEIRLAEEVKEGLSEENDRASAFVSEAINRIDTYIFQLHELARELNPSDFALDQRTYLKDEQIHDRIADRIDRLKEQGEANAPTEDPLLRKTDPEKE